MKNIYRLIPAALLVLLAAGCAAPAPEPTHGFLRITPERLTYCRVVSCASITPGELADVEERAYRDGFADGQQKFRNSI